MLDTLIGAVWIAAALLIPAAIAAFKEGKA